MGSAVYGVSSMSETPLTDRIPRPGVLELADRQLELSPGEFAVVTVGQIIAGTQSNIIVDRSVMELNLCTYSEETEAQVLAAIERIVRGECAAGGEEGTIPANHCPYSAPDPALTLQSGTEAIIVAARAWLG